MALNTDMASASSASAKTMKHQWTPAEDDKLVESLYELYTMGSWKCDRGFRSGYLHQLEKMMEQKMPRCGLKATPHIESRVKTLKKQTMAIAEMFTNGSGFGWNDETKMVACEKIVYDEWVKTHPSAKGLRNKQFPHYDILLEIFGKDRANGKGATTAAGEEEEIEAADTNVPEQSMPMDGLETMEFTSTQSQLPTPSPTPSSSTSPSTRKRKSSDGWSRSMSEVSSSLKQMADGTMTYLDKIGAALVEDSANSKAVAQELQRMDGLTLQESMAAAKAIMNDPSMIVYFLSLPTNEKRKEMVIEVLSKST